MLNGETTLALTTLPAISGAVTSLQIVTLCQFTAGDYVTIQAYQDSGDTLTVGTAPPTTAPPGSPG